MPTFSMAATAAALRITAMLATAVTVHLDNSGNAGDQAVGDTYINIVGAFGSNFGDSLFGDNGNNWIVACDGNDLVSGGRGDDILYGSNGDDTLIGGVGNDTLIGEAGRDIFVFNTALNAAGNVDQLSGFNIYEDRIQLDRRHLHDACNRHALGGGVHHRRLGNVCSSTHSLQQRHRRSVLRCGWLGFASRGQVCPCGCERGHGAEGRTVFCGVTA